MEKAPILCPVEILLIEDNPGDMRLIKEAFKSGKVHNNMYWAKDGEEGLAFLRQEGKFSEAIRPDVIFLDLNLPKYSGQEILELVKQDESLKTIPVIILTSSQAEEDVCRSYSLHANCYISKPVDMNKFISVVKSIDSFWLSVVTLPTA